MTAQAVVTEVIRGSLTIEGWALARSGVASVEIEIDGSYLGAAFHGIRRPDVAEAFPGLEGAGVSGFGLTVAAGALDSGRHSIRVKVLAKSGAGSEAEFSVQVARDSYEDGPWVLRRKMPLAEVQLGERILSGLRWRPIFGLLLGVGEVDDEVAAARRTLASLRNQAYAAWHVTVLRRGMTVPDDLAARLVDGFDDIADRITIHLDAAADLRLASLAGSRRQQGQCDLLGVLLAGDVLGCDALSEMAIGSGLHPDAELFYCDEGRISAVSGWREAFFKPQWSPDLLLATNYIGRFWCALPSVFSRAAATVGDWIQFGDYDLVLRCTEATSGIRHLPSLLCERGRPHLDHALQGQAALQRAIARRGIAGDIVEGCAPGYYRIKRARRTGGLVSIIIPTCAADGLIETCLETLRAKTAYRNIEIICVENIPPSREKWKRWLEQCADKVVTMDDPFNWSRFNNVAARQAKGEFLLFLNDDTEIIEPDWLDALLEHAERPEIGAVGARLLYPDRKVQHAGMFWTPQGGRHAFRLAAESDPGYFGLALTERNVLAVTGACLMVRREEFEAQGGFDEAHTIVNNDVDYCLRCWERGKRVVYTPYATLVHHELASRHQLGEDFDSNEFSRRWGRRLQFNDPFYHPHLSRYRDDYNYDSEPVELVYSSRPLFDGGGVREILAVKLDHIGDFIIAIPALQRLQELFPQARLHLLAAPGSAALAGLVPGLASVIEFEFFHARSGLGERELSQDDLLPLRRRLEPYRFDLAVDLRKHPETRSILRLSGARWLAGFDHNRQFPWLDIVMEWEQDPATVRKRSHISDDLIRLVDATASAARATPNLSPPSAARSQILPARGAERRAQKRIVCVHPGVGSPIRQWPAEHYAALIDLLVAAHDVEIVIIGSQDEAEIAEQVISKLRRADSVRSLVGKVALPDLAKLLSSAALFVGNNSGPKHLAAGLGVPTVGIHSGTVDAREWGPIGRNAVAIRRNTSCSPCYLSDPTQCWRELACLVELRPPEVYEICARLLAIDMEAGV